jgi:hypothetical protein
MRNNGILESRGAGGRGRGFAVEFRYPPPTSTIIIELGII